MKSFLKNTTITPLVFAFFTLLIVFFATHFLIYKTYSGHSRYPSFISIAFADDDDDDDDDDDGGSGGEGGEGADAGADADSSDADSSADADAEGFGDDPSPTGNQGDTGTGSPAGEGDTSEGGEGADTPADAEATAADFGAESGFGLGEAEATAEAEAANAAAEAAAEAVTAQVAINNVTEVAKETLAKVTEPVNIAIMAITTALNIGKFSTPIGFAVQALQQAVESFFSPPSTPAPTSVAETPAETTTEAPAATPAESTEAEAEAEEATTAETEAPAETAAAAVAEATEAAKTANETIATEISENNLESQPANTETQSATNDVQNSENALSNALNELSSSGEGNKIGAWVGSADTALLNAVFDNIFSVFNQGRLLQSESNAAVSDSSPNLLGFLKRALHEIQKSFNEDARLIEYAGNTGQYTLESVSNIISKSIDTLEGLDSYNPELFTKRAWEAQRDLLTATFDATRALGEQVISELQSRTQTKTASAKSSKEKSISDILFQRFPDYRKQRQIVPPEVSFTSSRDGDTVVLKWDSSRAQSCTGNNFEVDDKTSGEVRVAPKEATIYTITCSVPEGSKTVRSITVIPPSSSAPLPTVLLKASSDFSGREITLSWESANTTSCTGVHFETEGKTSGSAHVTQTADTAYTLTCTGLGGSQTRTATFEFSEESELSQNPTITLRHVRNEAILTWTAPIPRCTISGTDGFLFTTETKTGSVNAGPLKSGVSYTIDCQVEQGQIAD